VQLCQVLKPDRPSDLVRILQQLPELLVRCISFQRFTPPSFPAHSSRGSSPIRIRSTIAEILACAASTFCCAVVSRTEASGFPYVPFKDQVSGPESRPASSFSRPSSSRSFQQVEKNPHPKVFGAQATVRPALVNDRKAPQMKIPRALRLRGIDLIFTLSV